MVGSCVQALQKLEIREDADKVVSRFIKGGFLEGYYEEKDKDPGSEKETEGCAVIWRWASLESQYRAQRNPPGSRAGDDGGYCPGSWSSVMGQARPGGQSDPLISALGGVGPMSESVLYGSWSKPRQAFQARRLASPGQRRVANP